MDKELWQKNLKKAQKAYTGPVHVPWKKVVRVSIEPTNRCNADCVMCQHSHTMEVLGPQDLPKQDIKRFIDEASQLSQQFGGLKAVRFGVFGEPLLYPDIVEVVKYGRKVADKVSVTSNISKLDESLSVELLEAGMTGMLMSIDHCNKADYESLRRGLKWDNIVKNARRFRQIRDEGEYDCRIVVNTVLGVHNKSEANAISKFWSDVSDKEVVPSIERPIGDTWRVQPWFSPSKKEPPCVNMMVLKANGSLFCCCLDVFRGRSLGNIYGASISEIFHGDKIKRHRQALRTLIDLPYCCEICHKLPMFQQREHYLDTELCMKGGTYEI